jgi:hypothetical protein
MWRALFGSALVSVALGQVGLADQVGPFQWSGNGHYYALAMPSSYSDSFTWTNANTAATQAGGYLATVTSSAENDFLREKFSGYLFDNGYSGHGPEESEKGDRRAY